MSILKRVISLLLCLVMLTSVLASCDTDDSHDHETGESTTVQSQGTTSDHTHDETKPSDETPKTPEQHTHTPATAVTENLVDSTCTKTGSYDEVVYCSVCHEEISRTQKTIDKKAHEYNQKVTTSTYLKTSADCNNVAVYHYSCSCGAKGTTTFTDGEANGHSYSSSWEKNATHHWHKATCEHTGKISGEAEHDYGTDNICDTCEYDRTVNVSGVTLNFSSLALTVDDVKTLIATIAPNNATNQSVMWTTSKASVVTVDTNGNITAVGVGTAIITVTTADGNKTAQCTVVVSAKVCSHTATRTERENEIDSTCKDAGSYDEVVYCSACGDELSRTEKTIPKKNTHTNAIPVNENIVDSTCKEVGSYDEVVYCSVCGVEISRVEKTIDKKDTHTASSAVQENIVDSTCKEVGSYDEVIYCSVCGDELSRTEKVIPKKDTHTESTAVQENIVSSTCKDTGSYDEVVYCSICDIEMSRTTKTIDKQDTHTEGEPKQENYVDSTFESKGSYDEVIYCTVCGKELSRNTITIPEKSHTAGTAVVENKVDSTCKETGTYDEVVYCTECGEELSRVQKTIEKKTTHTEDETVTENLVDSTCKDEGSYDGVIYCSICDKELSRETKTIAKKTTHTADTAVQENIVDSTCKDVGSYDEVVYCSVCGHEISRTQKTIDKKNTHVEGEPQQENFVDSTFEAKGSYDSVVYCTVCGKELSRNTITIPEKTHTAGTAVVENKVDSTCGKTGTYDEVVYCTECGEELSRVQKTIEKKTTHTEDESVTENFVDSTCKIEGSYDEVVYCSICDIELSRETKTVAKKTTHTDGEALTEHFVDSTCADEGSYEEVVYCSVCNVEISRTEKTIAKKDTHTEGSAVEENRVESDCKNEGSYDTVVYCTVCNKELSRTENTIDKKPHTDGTPVSENIVDSTCTAVGSYDAVVYCSICGEELNRLSNTIDKKAHIYNKEIATELYLKSEATCTESAKYYYSCYCGAQGEEFFSYGNPDDHEYMLVTLDSTTFTYDGMLKKIEVENLPDCATVTYINNEQINAGEYEVTAIVNHGNQTLTLTATLTIKKAMFDSSSLAFENQIFTYDGNSKSIYVVGQLPIGVTVSYDNNGQINAGQYLVTAHFNAEASNYYPIDDIQAVMTINKATHDLSGVLFEDVTYIYDGTAKFIEISGELPQGVHVTYINNGQTNAGKYTVTVSFESDNANYYTIGNRTASLIIEKASYDMSDVVFNNKTFVYDSTAKSIFILGTLPNGVSVTYTGNEVINVGQYTVTASFSGDAANYNSIDSITAYITINKATPYISEVTCDEKLSVYSNVNLVVDANIEGTIVFDDDQELLLGYNEYTWTFIPNEANNYEIVIGTIWLNVNCVRVNFYNGQQLIEYQDIVINNSANVPSVIPVKNDSNGLRYTFSHWSIEENGSEYDFTSTVSDTLNLYAVYTSEEIKYTILYYNTKGAVNSNITKYTVSTSYVLQNLSKEHYVFDGWYNSAGERVYSIARGTTGTVSLYARWTPVEYSITYVSQYSDFRHSNPDTYNIESDFVLQNGGLDKYHSFEGWYLDKEFTIPFNQIVSNSSGSITLYAKWEFLGTYISTADEFLTITYDMCGAYELINDIEIDFTVGDETNPFTGYFRGNGHTIAASGNVFGDVSGEIYDVKTNMQLCNKNSGNIENCTAAQICEVNSGDIYRCTSMERGIATRNLSEGWIMRCISYGYSSFSWTTGEVIPNEWYLKPVNQKTTMCYGGIAAINQGFITECAVECNMRFTASASKTIELYVYVGGIAGDNSKGTILSSRFDGYIYFTADHASSFTDYTHISNINVKCYTYGGGIAGYGGSISDCYFRGFVSGKSDTANYAKGGSSYPDRIIYGCSYAYIGGIVGANGSVLNSIFIFDKYCYEFLSDLAVESTSTGEYDTEVWAGMIAASNTSIINSYYCGARISSSVGSSKVKLNGTASTEYNFKSATYISTNLEWDEEIWLLEDGSYPRLRWEANR